MKMLERKKSYRLLALFTAVAILASSVGMPNVAKAMTNDAEVINPTVIYPEGNTKAIIEFDLNTIDSTKYEIEKIAEKENKTIVYETGLEDEDNKFEYEVQENGEIQFEIEYKKVVDNTNIQGMSSETSIDETVNATGDTDTNKIKTQTEDSILTTEIKVNIDGIKTEENVEDSEAGDKTTNEDEAQTEAGDTNIKSKTMNDVTSTSTYEQKANNSLSDGTIVSTDAFNFSKRGIGGDVKVYNDSVKGGAVRITANGGQPSNESGADIMAASAVSKAGFDLDRPFVISGSVEMAAYPDGFGVGLIKSNTHQAAGGFDDGNLGMTNGIYWAQNFVGVEVDKYANADKANEGWCADDLGMQEGFSPHVTYVNTNLLGGGNFTPARKNGSANFHRFGSGWGYDSLNRAKSIDYTLEYTPDDGGTLKISLKSDTLARFSSTDIPSDRENIYKNIKQYYKQSDGSYKAYFLIAAAVNPYEGYCLVPGSKPVYSFYITRMAYTDLEAKISCKGMQSSSVSDANTYYTSAYQDTSGTTYFSGSKVIVAYEQYNANSNNINYYLDFYVKKATATFGDETIDFTKDIKAYYYSTDSPTIDQVSRYPLEIKNGKIDDFTVSRNSAKLYLFFEFEVPKPQDTSITKGTLNFDVETRYEAVSGIENIIYTSTCSRPISNEYDVTWSDFYIANGPIEEGVDPTTEASGITSNALKIGSYYDSSTSFSGRDLSKYLVPGETYQTTLSIKGRDFEKYGTEGYLQYVTAKVGNEDITLEGPIAVKDSKGSWSYYNLDDLADNKIPIEFSDKTIEIVIRFTVPDVSISSDASGNIPYLTINFNINRTKSDHKATGLSDKTVAGNTSKNFALADKPTITAMPVRLEPNSKIDSLTWYTLRKTSFGKLYDDPGSAVSLNDMETYYNHAANVLNNKFYYFDETKNKFVEADEEKFLTAQYFNWLGNKNKYETGLYAYQYDLSDARREKYANGEPEIKDLKTTQVVRMMFNDVDVNEQSKGLILSDTSSLSLTETEVSRLVDQNNYGSVLEFLKGEIGIKGFYTSDLDDVVGSTVKGKVVTKSDGGFNIKNPKQGTYNIDLVIYEPNSGTSVEVANKTIKLEITENTWSYDTDDRTEENGASGYIVIPKYIELERTSGEKEISQTSEVFFANYSSATGVKYELSVDKSFEMINQNDTSNRFEVTTSAEDGVEQGNKLYVGEINNSNTQGNGKTISFTASSSVPDKVKSRWMGNVTFYFDRK